MDARSYKMVEGERVKVNFLIFYEIDQQDVKTVLRLAEYGGDEDMSWILLDMIRRRVRARPAQAGANK